MDIHPVLDVALLQDLSTPGGYVSSNLLHTYFLRGNVHTPIINDVEHPFSLPGLL
jgi:hypothetical protein